ncbi:MAG: T9SS type A sorting domain-containing protein, partial [Candidatus Eisenbacteria sp.]|nr:T9SS type A sorting domain-containing protein [Candidatus Eisenbacteria bacterium]
QVALADVPLDLPAGTYRMDHPESWVPGDGTVPIAARGLDTGMGWLDGESGPGVIYDPDIDAVATLMDFFHLTINVATMIDVEYDVATLPLDDSDPGDVVCGDVTVNNIGNAEADDVHFVASDLTGQLHGGIISSISFPGGIIVPLGGSETFELCVTIPHDARADTYEGKVFLLADGATQFDELLVSVTVNCIPGMDVSADADALQLHVAVGDTVAANSRVFTLSNEGNCELTAASGSVTLDAGFVTTVTIEGVAEYDVEHGGEVDGLVTVSADPSQLAGTYHGTVTLTANAGAATDDFPITVIMPEFAAVVFEADGADSVGVAGESVTFGSIALRNSGNVDIDSGITFLLDPLVGNVTLSEIPGEFAMEPPVVVVDYGECAEFDLTINVPEGLLGQTYSGTLHVLVDGEPMDEFELSIILERGADYVSIYPNPFRMSENEGGCITIALGDVTGETAIMVYDMFGGLVKDLTFTASRGENVEWNLENDDGKTVASGMYIVTIDTGDEVVTRKIMVIK